MNEIELIVGKEFPSRVGTLIESAKDSIDIIAYDWRWYPNDVGSPVSLFASAIFRAVKRGVRVRVLINNDMVCARLQAQGVDAKRSRSKKLLHTKMLIFDNSTVVTGSHNLTQNAFALNEEASVCFSLPAQANSFVGYFQALWGV